MRNINTSSGSEFIRADLHIHSFGQNGSYDVNDTEMTPERIVDEAIKYELGIISITDHNEISNSNTAIQYSSGKHIKVIPGIEINTIQGHLLAYFETYIDLKKFYGKLSISADKTRCDQGLKQCLDLINEYNGIGIFAHIELSSGFEKTISRFSPIMDEIFCHKSLFGLEISKKDSVTLYTEDDDNDERKRMIRLRKNQLSFSGNLFLPKVMFSDAHSIANFGKNSSGANKLTRIKLDEKIFHGLKIALINHESRIRIEDEIPEIIPYFAGITIDGGLLDKQDIKFSKNLTCIIGGRGTGKSTLLESIRIASGNSTENSLVDCEIWPDEINLKYVDETKYSTEFRRIKDSCIENTTDASFGLDKVKIESYGQGETTATIKNSDDNPEQLLKFLDTFIDIKALQKEDEEICELLKSNSADLQKLRIELISETEYSKALRDLETKKARLERDNVGELVKYHSALQVEKNLRQNIVNNLKDIIKKYRTPTVDVEELKTFVAYDDEGIIIGKNEFSKAKQVINEFLIFIQDKNTEISTSLEEKIKLLQDIMGNWKNNETAIYEKIDKKKQELTEQGIPFDIPKINKLAEDIEFYRTKIAKCNQTKLQLKDCEDNRNNLIQKRILLRKRIFEERFLFAKRINESLQKSVDGLYVKLDYKKGCFSPAFEECLKKAMGWHTVQVNKAKIIANKLSPLLFSSYIKNNKKDLLKSAINVGRLYISETDIDLIVSSMLNEKKYEEFECLCFEDTPSLLITKIITNTDGKEENITKPISQLSLGQQQSILLAILLQSKSNDPLLIDQPEDNLDGEFIYKTIVKILRQIKEKRQVIIVTHNANIAVLGDAELVVPLKSTNLRSYLQNPGSIDRDNIRESCCEILEGGKQAFIDRETIYNIK